MTDRLWRNQAKEHSETTWPFRVHSPRMTPADISIGPSKFSCTGYPRPTGLIKRVVDNRLINFEGVVKRKDVVSSSYSLLKSCKIFKRPSQVDLVGNQKAQVLHEFSFSTTQTLSGEHCTDLQHWLFVLEFRYKRILQSLEKNILQQASRAQAVKYDIPSQYKHSSRWATARDLKGTSGQ